DDRARAARVIEPARDRYVRAEIARQAHADDPIVAFGDLLDNGEGAVVRVVVDDDPLPGHAGGLHHGAEPRVHDGKIMLLVMRGRNDREERRPDWGRRTAVHPHLAWTAERNVSMTWLCSASVIWV